MIGGSPRAASRTVPPNWARSRSHDLRASSRAWRKCQVVGCEGPERVLGGLQVGRGHVQDHPAALGQLDRPARRVGRIAMEQG